MELSKKQQEIVTTEKSKVIVLASAASGKTRVLIERVRYMLKQGVNPGSILVITFTNAAANELKSRLGDDYKGGLNVSTLHSYVNRRLTMYGVDTRQHIDEEDFDGLLELAQKNPQIWVGIDHVLLDEAQDSTPEQFSFILDLLRPQTYFFVGDDKQVIYSYAGVNPAQLRQMTYKDDVTTYKLSENYRNAKNILDAASSIIDQIGLSDHSIPMRGDAGEVHYMEFDIDEIAEIIEEEKKYKDWFILARSNEQVNTIIKEFTLMGIPTITFKRKDLQHEEAQKLLEKDAVRVLTIHVAKGLESPNVVVVGARFFNPEEVRIGYVAATRAQDKLYWTRARKKRRMKY